MPLLLLPLFFLFLASCSDNLLYNEAAPHVSIKILSPLRDTTILAGNSMDFEAEIEPSITNIGNFYWSIDSRARPYPGLRTKETFDSTGIYNAKFYAVDFLGDTLSSKNVTIKVSNMPVCDSLSLEIFYGSPIFKWNCYDLDNDKLTYTFLLKNKNKTIINTVLQENSMQLGYALPNDQWEVRITATNSFGFKAELDSAWSAP
ncbi:MAG: hypothetical protein FWC26_15390 [Fibromonadales bacterium]|nr:hypothetical protein [Fibromonadales bacterium]